MAGRRGATRLVLIGLGAIGQAVARLLSERSAAARIVAVGLRRPGPRPGLPAGAQVITDPAELAASRADLVVEAAGRESVAPWARAALAAGTDFAVSSTSAFTDAALLDELTALARQTGARLLVPAGALGGVGALASAARMGLERVEHRIVKPPRAWAGTEAEALCDLAALTVPAAFFTGTASEAALRFPQNANVALITALAGLGPERTMISLIADPGAVVNRHVITASGAFGALKLEIASSPLPENPKSSSMTALSLVRLIENRDSELVL
ncbi:MAG: aspartate dehydrogenase [Pararhodobacter sp.]|nr:aspartate dehydrogenase [Pararhodobacter sp.]